MKPTKEKVLENKIRKEAELFRDFTEWERILVNATIKLVREDCKCKAHKEERRYCVKCMLDNEEKVREECEKGLKNVIEQAEGLARIDERSRIKKEVGKYFNKERKKYLHPCGKADCVRHKKDVIKILEAEG